MGAEEHLFGKTTLDFIEQGERLLGTPEVVAELKRTLGEAAVAKMRRKAQTQEVLGGEHLVQENVPLHYEVPGGPQFLTSDGEGIPTEAEIQAAIMERLKGSPEAFQSSREEKT